MLKLIKPHFTVGYSSHGYLSTLNDIVEAEQQRENEPFIDYDPADVEPYAQRRAIWVTIDPFDAFHYCLMAEESDQPKQTIIQQYPNWRDEVEAINTDDFLVLEGSDDGDGGIVLVEKII